MALLINRKRVITIISMVVVSIFMVCIYIGCKTQPTTKNTKVLVVHSFRSDFVSYPDMNRMIVSDLGKKGIKADIQTFYLNCDALTDVEELAVLHQYVDTMKVKPKIIMTTDDQATYSLLACKHPFLKKIPIVFTGVNFPNWDLLKEYSNVTGIWDKLNYLSNVEMIEKLMGHQRIRFYYDRTFIGRKIIGELAEQLGNRDKELYNMLQHFLQNPDTANITKTEYNLGFLKEKELSKELTATIFYFLNLREVAGGSLLWCINGKFEHSVSLLTRYDYTMSRIGRMATIPTFSVVNKGVGYGQGILGGSFMTIQDQVEEACDYVVQILRGRRISTLPIKEGRKKFVLDWKEMERWNISVDSIPEDYMIINMPFYERYKLAFILLGGFSTALILSVIVYLSFLFRREQIRKQKVQQNLKEEKEFLSLVLEGGNIFAWHYNQLDELFIFDKDFAVSVGMISEKISLNDLVQITHPEDVDNAINLFIDVVNRKEDKATVCVRMNFNGKGFIWYEFRMLGVPERQDKQSVVVGAILNIQDIKENEQSLILARDLAAKTELKQSFLANMSHEIRTPLNAIVGFSNILVTEEELIEEEKIEFITTINKNCELLLKLINDILEISRIESGNMSFLMKPACLNEIVEDVYQMNCLAVPHSLKFIKEIPFENIMLTTDSARLKQVLVNLVNNAFKFTSSGYVKIGMNCDNPKGQICLYVEDTGMGIPEEEQKIIFERFYKRDEFAQGTGLGLSICMVIVDKLKGKLMLTSKVNKGSRFEVILPCDNLFTGENLSAMENHVEKPDNEISVENLPIVLIAEDSVSNYMVLSRILKKYFTIIWALNGQDALDIVNRQHVDLVLMDIKMHELDGLTALKKIRKNHKKLPVIIQTAYAYDENREQAKKAGCAGFIEKPIRSDVLMDAIGKCMLGPWNN